MGTIMDVTLDLLNQHNPGTPPHYFFFEKIGVKVGGGFEDSSPGDTILYKP